MIDCTPLNLAEAENYCFDTKCISIYACQPSIRHEVERIVQDSLGKLLSVANCSLEATQKDLNKQLEYFSNTRLKELIGTTLGTAVAKATLQVHNTIHGSNVAQPYNAWIEYWEIEQSVVDKYPDWLRKQIYTKYIEGYGDIHRSFDGMSRNSQIRYLERHIKNALQPYLGRRSDRSTCESMKNEIQHVLSEFGLYGNVDFNIEYSSSRRVSFTIEADSHSARSHVLCDPYSGDINDYFVNDRRRIDPIRINIEINV